MEAFGARVEAAASKCMEARAPIRSLYPPYHHQRLLRGSVRRATVQAPA